MMLASRKAGLRRLARGAMAVVAAIVSAILPASAQAPPTPQHLCQMAAYAGQTGGPALYTVFGQQLSYVMFQQTGGTGIYMPLVQLGQITNVIIGGVTQLPNGTFVSCRVVHVNGMSDWQLGFSPYTQRIENSTVTPYWTGGQQAMPQPVAPQPSQPIGTLPPIQQPTGKPDSQPPSATQSEACKKFPNLC
jgi:hypothetical protein